MRLLFIILLVSLSLSVFSQRTYLHGIVRDSSTLEALIGVHISNVSSQKLTNNEIDGSFKIPVKEGDSLLLTYVGYKSVSYIVKENWSSETIPFFLEQKATQLSEVEVNLFPEYVRFKQLVLETNPVDSTFHIDLPELFIPYSPPTAQQLQHPDLAPSVGFQFDMAGLTKKGKEQKKFQKLLESKSITDKAYRKFDREWVSQKTKLKGDQLTNFIAYCKFTPEYLVETPLFFIHERMMALLEDFQEGKKRSKNQRYTPGA
ncbi:carboxypeptidase-like regulatory domain-containing protein [Ekhidna sp.]